MLFDVSYYFILILDVSSYLLIVFVCLFVCLFVCVFVCVFVCLLLSCVLLVVIIKCRLLCLALLLVDKVSFLIIVYFFLNPERTETKKKGSEQIPLKLQENGCFWYLQDKQKTIHVNTKQNQTNNIKSNGR